MIIVSGTKRSGTSMWMQVMHAAGFPVVGEKFSANWEKTMKDANQGGFYESPWRAGVYFATNPDPRTQRYYSAEEVAGHAVKVFIPGVLRTERAYIEVLVANVRPWREYESSVKRLYEMEASHRGPEVQPIPTLPPAYEWWNENYSLIRNISVRRFKARLLAYPDVLADPHGAIERVLGFIGKGDIEKASAAVVPERRTQKDTVSDTLSPKLAQVFDDLYGAIEGRRGFSESLLKQMAETHAELAPELRKMQEDAQREWKAWRDARGLKGQPGRLAPIDLETSQSESE